ncbi:transposase [Streptomyces sp. NPDC050564]|uniref:IS110 family transposase n=1 Tax=Streptomyces sp. NPDC050564 TaxID=3365631 RepID=UPI0037AB1F16
MLALLADVLALDEDVVWAVDVADGMAALLVNLLLNHAQQLVYLPGMAVNRASAGYRGMGKTDAKEGAVRQEEHVRGQVADQVVGVVGLALGGGAQDRCDQAAGVGFVQGHEHQPGVRCGRARPGCARGRGRTGSRSR